MSPKEVLIRVDNQVRRGDFEKGVLDDVLEYGHKWGRFRDEALRLKGTYLSAEVFDYFGDYNACNRLLKVEGPAMLDSLRRRVAGSGDDTLRKRAIWLVLAWATAQYRDEKYEDAADTLASCQVAIDALDPQAQGLWGTRARLAYSTGQVARQQHDHELARRNFDLAIVYANRRFTAKTGFAELPHHHLSAATNSERKVFEMSKLLAQWTIGKCTGLGLGWIAYTTGRLSIAETLMSAGYSLLRGTGDEIHRAYVTLLLGSVERAKAGDDENKLRRAIDMLENAALGLAEHPTFKLRASYELALAYYKQDSTRQKARDEVSKIKEGLGSGLRSLRWKSAALVIESRIERIVGKYMLARQLAHDAVHALEGTKHTETQAEAYIALGEANLALADDHRSRQLPEASKIAIAAAIAAFKTAQDRVTQNPKISAVTHLHLATAHQRAGSLSDAYASYAVWADRLHTEVEHGFVQALGHRVADDLKIGEVFFVDNSMVDPNIRRSQHVERLDAFLLRMSMAKGWSQRQTCENFGVSKSQLNKRKRQLSDYGVVTRKPGRPPASLKPKSVLGTPKKRPGR